MMRYWVLRAALHHRLDFGKTMIGLAGLKASEIKHRVGGKYPMQLGEGLSVNDVSVKIN